MNSKFGPSPTTQLPWLPNQLSSLCRNTGIRGGRLRPDDISIKPVVPKPKPDCRDGLCMPLPTTYFTRRGALFIYPASTEVQPWQSQVTPSELNRLADQRVKNTMKFEGKQRRKELVADHLRLTGVLKQNIEFPSSWMSPARETVPDVAIRRGLTVAEFILQNSARSKYAFGPKHETGFTYEPLNAPHVEESGILLNLDPYVAPAFKTKNKGFRRNFHQKSENLNNPGYLLSKIKEGPQALLTFGQERRQLDKHIRRYNALPPISATKQLIVPRIKLNSQNSWRSETSTRLLLSRSSLASDDLSIFGNVKWSETSSDYDEFELKSPNSDENEEEGNDFDEAEWSYESTRSSYVDSEQFHHPTPPVRRQRALSCSVDGSSVVGYPARADVYNQLGAQINVNAVCPESSASGVERDASVNQTNTPSLTTGATNTTGASSRWSRATPNTNTGHLTHSPNRTTPASTPSRKTATNQTSLLDMAKMLLTESSKLDQISSTTPCNLPAKNESVDPMLKVGGGDAIELAESDKIRANIERKRQREANELQKQISALAATIEKLYERTREKTVYLNAIVTDTFHQIQTLSNQRALQRKNKQNQRRRLTSELFLRHFRDRQARKRRLRIKLAHPASKSGSSNTSRSTDRLPIAFINKEIDENEALRQWETKENARDSEENTKQLKLEEEAATKATARLRCLREVANSQLRHLEEFIRVNNPTSVSKTGEVRDESSPEASLPELRLKQQRLINLLQMYGITTEEEDKKGHSYGRQSSAVEGSVPATIALRNLWSDLQQEKLQKLQRQALNHFERALPQGRRTPLTRPLMSPASRRRGQWKHDALLLMEYGNCINSLGFSYFDFWKPKEVSSDDEDDRNKKRTQIVVRMTQSQLRKQEYIRKKVSLHASELQKSPERRNPRRPIKRDVHVH